MSESNGVSKEKVPAAGKRFNLRGFFSLLLFSSFTVLLVTGVILYFTPKGRVAHWTGWTVLGIGKEEWSAIHMVLSLVVIISAGFHLYYNWGIFWGYITRKAQAGLNLKREMALALLVCVVAFAGTLYNVPPFSTFIAWNDAIKVYWEEHSAHAPVPHAEEFPITRLAEEVDVPLEQAVERLEEAGISVEDPSVKVNKLGGAHGLTPSEVLRIVKPDYPQRGGRGMGMGRGGGRGMGGGGGAGMGGGGGASMGYGRMSVEQVCENMGVAIEDALARLKAAGIEAKASERLSAVAARAGKTPRELADVVGGQ